MPPTGSSSLRPRTWLVAGEFAVILLTFAAGLVGWIPLSKTPFQRNAGLFLAAPVAI